MERITARTADRTELRDIKDVVIDTSKPCSESENMSGNLATLTATATVMLW